MESSIGESYRPSCIPRLHRQETQGILYAVRLQAGWGFISRCKMQDMPGASLGLAWECAAFYGPRMLKKHKGELASIQKPRDAYPDHGSTRLAILIKQRGGTRRISEAGRAAPGIWHVRAGTGAQDSNNYGRRQDRAGGRGFRINRGLDLVFIAVWG